MLCPTSFDKEPYKAHKALQRKGKTWPHDLAALEEAQTVTEPTAPTEPDKPAAKGPGRPKANK